MVAGSHDVANGEDRGELFVGVIAVGDFIQRSVSERYIRIFALSGVIPIAMQTVSLAPARQFAHVPSLSPNGIMTKSPGLKFFDVFADLIDDANAFMPDLTTARHLADTAVKPQVAAAHARPHHSDDSVGRLLYHWLVNVFAYD